jgi:glutamate synthase domain-containing protein 3
VAGTVRIDARGMHYTPLNQLVRKAVSDGSDEIILDNIMGQRFIADGLRGKVSLIINGVPGGDLGMFMSGPICTVHGNAEHAPGNTMDDGRIVIHGSAGDAVAHSMRGGQVFVRDDIGYRGGIHMKQFREKCPALVVGGTARAFLGEYMAGGLVIVLGRHGEEPVPERGTGSGIHGGEIFVRGEVRPECLGVGAMKRTAGKDEIERISPFIREFAKVFDLDPEPLVSPGFTRITPGSKRPFADNYTWE